MRNPLTTFKEREEEEEEGDVFLLLLLLLLLRLSLRRDRSVFLLPAFFRGRERVFSRHRRSKVCKFGVSFQVHRKMHRQTVLLARQSERKRESTKSGEIFVRGEESSERSCVLYRCFDWIRVSAGFL